MSLIELIFDCIIWFIKLLITICKTVGLLMQTSYYWIADHVHNAFQELKLGYKEVRDAIGNLSKKRPL